MLDSIRRFFEEKLLVVEDNDRALQLAAVALLIEVALADSKFNDRERRAIVAAVQDMFDICEEETQEIIRLAEKERDQVTSLFDFTRLVNEHFDHEQKLKLIELMWQVSFADADKDKYEEHLIRKVAELIYVPHSDFVRLREQVR